MYCPVDTGKRAHIVAKDDHAVTLIYYFFIFSIKIAKLELRNPLCLLLLLYFCELC